MRATPTLRVIGSKRLRTPGAQPVYPQAHRHSGCRPIGNKRHPPILEHTAWRHTLALSGTHQHQADRPLRSVQALKPRGRISQMSSQAGGFSGFGQEAGAGPVGSERAVAEHPVWTGLDPEGNPHRAGVGRRRRGAPGSAVNRPPSRSACPNLKLRPEMCPCRRLTPARSFGTWRQTAHWRRHLLMGFVVRAAGVAAPTGRWHMFNLPTRVAAWTAFSAGCTS